MLESLTKRQQEVLEFIIKFTRENGYQPTFREIGEAMKMKSTRAVSDHINAIKRKGYMESDPGRARSFAMSPKSGFKKHISGGVRHVSLRGGYVALGQMSEANDHDEDTFAFDESLVKGQNTFILRAKGDSMINAHIQDNDFVLVNPDEKLPKNGDIVAARLDDEATIKRFFRLSASEIQLLPENEHYEPIHIHDHQGNFEIIGKVVGIFRQM